MDKSIMSPFLTHGVHSHTQTSKSTDINSTHN